MCEHMLRHTKTMPFSAQNDKNGHKNSHQPGGNTAHVTLQTARLAYQNEPNGIVERPEPMHNNAM